ncbi:MULTISPECIES: 3-oxoadipate enol-lactonase [Thalassospira]|uniref:3-oxoadipate enol-lactonase n=2 Tax=Thalassospira tepidiphila TaxID=393657 RepID=A0A853KVX8_9PROT|nr:MULTISPECIES: 3-oxoadipate enol-lactonase [Thalassospira]MBE71793.1 3-oxoadipate enol-lactonase [Thalassospira sp.]NJB75662.1 3-oxoadipate enol-lactonase [Thalassospira tepidiphila]OAZ08442.1 3-oxoadipate enol-lactonase [Thalassospira tepidiphila MCCC 1A03514]|tara:strand:+ start:533 stop:1333 length:801 start_codon:yes stop_codon:yes gene_type:complete
MSLQVAPVNGTHIHYSQSGPKNGPALVFANSLGTDLRIWDDVVDALSSTFNIVTYDKRGHGLSGIGDAPYDVALHANDLIGLLDYLGLDQVIICGLSVGGLIAQKVTELVPNRVRGLILCDTAAKLGDYDSWNTRIEAIKADGIASMGDAIMERWLSPTFRKERVLETAMYRDMLVRTTVEGYIGTCIALRDGDLRDAAAKIAVPTLCICGSEDLATPPDVVRATADMIPNAEFELIDGVGHLPCIETPELLTRLIDRFTKEKNLV